MDGSMLNYLWGCMILIGVVYAALTGNIDSVTSGALEGAKDAVSLCITMLGVMAFWCGLMEIAEKSGLIDKCKCGVALIYKLALSQCATTVKSIFLYNN